MTTLLNIIVYMAIAALILWVGDYLVTFIVIGIYDVYLKYKLQCKIDKEKDDIE